MLTRPGKSEAEVVEAEAEARDVACVIKTPYERLRSSIKLLARNRTVRTHGSQNSISEHYSEVIFNRIS